MVALTSEAMYFSFAVMCILFIAGSYMRDAALVATSGIISTLIGIYILQSGFQGQSNFMIQALGLLLAILGGYVFMRVLFEQMVVESNEFGGT